MAVYGPDLGNVPDINAFRMHESKLGLHEWELILSDKGNFFFFFFQLKTKIISNQKKKNIN
jgi:hypothetical protein